MQEKDLFVFVSLELIIYYFGIISFCFGLLINNFFIVFYIFAYYHTTLFHSLSLSLSLLFFLSLPLPGYIRICVYNGNMWELTIKQLTTDLCDIHDSLVSWLSMTETCFCNLYSSPITQLNYTWLLISFWIN